MTESHYNIPDPFKEVSALLTRDEWAQVLVCLGPDDATEEIYAKLEKQLNIFEDKNS